MVNLVHQAFDTKVRIPVVCIDTGDESCVI